MARCATCFEHGVISIMVGSVVPQIWPGVPINGFGHGESPIMVGVRGTHMHGQVCHLFWAWCELNNGRGQVCPKCVFYVTG